MKILIRISILGFLIFFELIPCRGQIQRSVDSVRYLIDHTEEDTVKLYYIISLSSLVKKYDRKKAFEIAKEAVALANHITYKCHKAMAYDNLAYMYYELNKLDSSLLIYNKALEILDTVKCKDKLGEIYNGIGITYREKGDFIKSIEYHQKALNICNTIGDTTLLITVLRTIGIPFRHLGKDEETLKYYFRALRLAEETNRMDELAYLNNNIGSVYLGQNFAEKALPYLQVSKRLLEKLDYKNDLITVTINLAVAYSHLDSFQRSLKYYTTAEQYAKETDNSQALALILTNAGGLYFRQGKYKQSLQYHMKANKIATKQNHYFAIYNSLFGIGQVYHATNQNTKAIQYLNRALKTSREIGYILGIRNTTELLSEVYEKQGLYKEALVAHKEFFQANDSLFHESKIEEITRMEMQYEFDKVQGEQELLNKQKSQAYEAELKQQKQYRNAAITGFIIIVIIAIILIYIFRLKQKQRVQKLQTDLFQYMQKSMSQQMNPHFIFNTLTSIQYFLDQNEREEGMKYVQKFAQLMRTALNNSQHATVSIADEIEFLKLYADLEALRFQTPFDLQIEIENEIDQQHYQIPAFLLQPIVENSIKHGIATLDEKGKIYLGIQHKNGILHCIVEDNGVGIKVSKNYLAEKSGIMKKHKSMATNLLQKRLQLLGLYYSKDFILKYSSAQKLSGTRSGTRVELDLPVIYSE